MWLSVGTHVIIIFLFSQLSRQPLVYLRACSCQDRSRELASVILTSLLIITVVVPLSAFFTMIVSSRNRSFNARLSQGDGLSFGLFIGMFASSNFTSSRKVSKATYCWTGGSHVDLT